MSIEKYNSIFFVYNLNICIFFVIFQACKQTLKKICPILDAPSTNNMVQTHLIDSAKLHITNFTTDLIKCLVNEHPTYIPQLIESTMNYLNSPWENIRANSVIIIG